MAKCIFFLVIVFLFFNCNSNSRKKMLTTNSDEFIVLNLIDTKGASKCHLLVFKDSSNLILKLVDTNNRYLYDISGCGNCDLWKEDTSYLRPKHLDKNSSSDQYVAIAPINESTYGAEYLFIFWFDGNNWNITRSNFVRFSFYDFNKDGIEEVIAYVNSKDSIIYNFSQGSWIKYVNSN